MPSYKEELARFLRERGVDINVERYVEESEQNDSPLSFGVYGGYDPTQVGVELPSGNVNIGREQAFAQGGVGLNLGDPEGVNLSTDSRFNYFKGEDQLPEEFGGETIKYGTDGIRYGGTNVRLGLPSGLSATWNQRPDEDDVFRINYNRRFQGL